MKKILDEKFSPSMPSWLKKVLTSNQGELTTILNYSERLLPNQSGTISLTDADFITIPVPDSARKFPEKDRNDIVLFLHVMLMGRDSVIVKFPTSVINDNKKFWNANTGEWITYKNSSWTKILQATSDICYVELNSKNITDIGDIRRGRRNAQSGSDIDIPHADYYGDLNTSTSTNKGYKLYRFRNEKDKDKYVSNSASYNRDKYKKNMKLDKSGYLLDPNLLGTLQKKFPSYRKDKLLKQVDSLYRRWYDAMDALSEMAFDDSVWGRGKDDLYSLYDKLEDAQSCYNSGVTYAKRAEDDWDIEHASSSFKRADRYLSDVEKYTKGYGGKNSSVDWDADDMYVDDVNDED